MVRDLRRSALLGSLLLTLGTLGCSGSPTDSYVGAMDAWVAELTAEGGGLDPDAVLFAGPQPPSPPSDLAGVHDLFVRALHLQARTEMVRDYHASLVGIAAAFCDPREEGVTGQAFYAEITGLQSWSGDGEQCVDSHRWAGNFTLGGGPPTTYEAPCSREFASDFGVYGTQLEWACANATDARLLREQAEATWRTATAED